MKPKRHDHRHDHRPDNSYQLRVYRTIKGNLQAPIAFFPLLNANLDLNFFQVVSLFVIRIKYQWRKGSSNTCQELQCNIDFMVFRKNVFLLLQYYLHNYAIVRIFIFCQLLSILEHTYSKCTDSTDGRMTDVMR